MVLYPQTSQITNARKKHSIQFNFKGVFLFNQNAVLSRYPLCCGSPPVPRNRSINLAEFQAAQPFGAFPQVHVQMVVFARQGAHHTPQRVTVFCGNGFTFKMGGQRNRSDATTSTGRLAVNPFSACWITYFAPGLGTMIFSSSSFY